MLQDDKQLVSIGFEDAARWKRVRGVLKHVGHKPARWRWLTAKPNLLYAFCSEGRVLHIGRSAQTLSRRFAHFSGEKAPSPDQEFQKKIGKLLDSGKDVSILVLANDAPLYWAPFTSTWLLAWKNLCWIILSRFGANEVPFSRNRQPARMSVLGVSS